MHADLTTQSKLSRTNFHTAALSKADLLAQLLSEILKRFHTQIIMWKSACGQTLTSTIKSHSLSKESSYASRGLCIIFFLARENFSQQIPPRPPLGFHFPPLLSHHCLLRLSQTAGWCICGWQIMWPTQQLFSTRELDSSNTMSLQMWLVIRGGRTRLT